MVGGFAALEASPRRVAGVLRLYWCNSPHATAGDMGVVARASAMAAGGVGVTPTVQTTSMKNG